MTINGINFSNLATTRPSKNASVAGTLFDLNNKFWELEEGESPSKLVNAVEIDWNGAVLPNASTTNGGEVTINTTGELLKLINDMQDEIYVLTAAVIALTQN